MTNLDLSTAPTQPDGPANSGPVLEFRNVSIGFEHPVLDDVSFSVGPSETRILLGPAGVGKSVLLKLANGLLYPDSGSIYLFGEEISQHPRGAALPPAHPHRHGLSGRCALRFADGPR